jgi:hypothetical protein
MDQHPPPLCPRLKEKKNPTWVDSKIHISTDGTTGLSDRMI